MQTGARFEGACDRSSKRDFQAIQNPSNSEGYNHQRMKSSPGKTVETGRNAGFESNVGHLAHASPPCIGCPEIAL